MANAFYTPAQVGQILARLVSQDTVLAALVSRNYQDELMAYGKGGAPIGIKMPTTLIARDRDIDDVTTSIILDEIAETFRTVNLDRKHDYSAVPLSEKDMTLNLVDFGVQVLSPQAKAIVDAVERKVALKLLGVPKTAAPVAWNPANPLPYFTALRKQLRDNGVDQTGMQCVVGTAVYAQLVDANALTDVSQSGSTEALREAGVGRIRGFSLIESTRVPEDEILAFHRDAVTLVTRAPVIPAGASFGTNIAEGGFNLRYIRDYDAMHTVDRSIVSTFSGVGILPTFKIERNYTTRAVVTTELPNGGVLHLDTVA